LKVMIWLVWEWMMSDGRYCPFGIAART